MRELISYLFFYIIGILVTFFLMSIHDFVDGDFSKFRYIPIIALVGYIGFWCSVQIVDEVSKKIKRGQKHERDNSVGM